MTHIGAYADLATENGTTFATCNYELLLTTKVTLRSKVENFGLVRNQGVNSFYSSFETIFVG